MFDLNRFLYFDGGMGTLLQAMGLQGGQRPERWNLLHPQRILDVHRSYLQAGCNVVTSNTFGATFAHLGDDALPCMRAGVRIARQAVQLEGHGLVACDMGSLGRLIAPLGDLPFDDAVDQFTRAFVAGLDEGADLILIETMTDLSEVKAAVVAAQDAMLRVGRTVPLLVSLTFDLDGRLLTGADIPGAAAMLQGMRVSAVGLNCGHQPDALLDNIRALLRSCDLPVFVQPNASLPVVVDGVTTFPTTPQDFARQMAHIATLGVQGLGGCCGTTPEHIRLLVEATQHLQPVPRETIAPCVVSGTGKSVELGRRPLIIGERLNPTGKPRMKQALRENDMDHLLREAVSQLDNGAHILDLNVGLPEVDEPAMLPAAMQAVQAVCDAPIQLDTADPRALSAALRRYVGKPLINSVCGKQHVMDEVFPLAARYGGVVVALTLDEQGIPPTVEGRMAIARRIVSEAQKHGLSKQDLIFDALTMTVATDPSAAMVTLQTVRSLHAELGVKTVLGVSNVSFGLPARPLLNASFLSMAVLCGLDAAIMNPGDPAAKAAFLSACALTCNDDGFADYLLSAPGLTAVPSAASSSAPAAAAPAESTAAPQGDALCAAITKGIAGDATRAAQHLLDGGAQPMELIERSVMPALGHVGDRYEKGVLFLPQLLQSASAAQAAFDVIRARMPAAPADPARQLVLATVRGDVHDIGKNIVKVLLQNYGFTVHDLGKDVPADRILSEVRRTGATYVGLSALMTTTVPAMQHTIDLLRREAPHVRVIVGGAVLTADYARTIGAHLYAPDAMSAVRLLRG